MKTIDYSLLKTGQTFLVCSGNPDFFCREIKKFQALKYPADVAKFNHAGKLAKIADQWWVVEEGRISGVVNTPLEDYLASDSSTYMIREPLAMTPEQQQKFIMCFVRDDNKGHYAVGAIFNFAYHFLAYKLTHKEEYLNMSGNQKNFVCSTKCEEWDNEVLGIFGKPFTMCPAEYVVTPLYKTIITI